MNRYATHPLKRAICPLFLTFLFVGSIGVQSVLAERAGTATWVSFGDGATPTPASVEAQKQIDGVSIELTVHGILAQKRETPSGEFQAVTIPGADATNEAGRPQLPVVRCLLRVPDVAEFTLQVEEEQHTTLAGYRVYPAPAKIVEHAVDGTAAIGDEFCLDTAFYETDDIYPERMAHIASSGHLREQRFIQVEMVPIRYRPGSTELIVTSYLRLRLAYRGGLPTVGSGSPSMGVGELRMAPATVSQTSSRAQVDYPNTLAAIHSADYLIIAADSLYNSEMLRQLAAWRAQYSRLDVVVVSTSQVYAAFAAGSSGADSSIRNIIQHAYDTWQAPHMQDGRLGYVLLVGDVELLPIHLSGPGYFLDESIATDNWYACVSGDDSMPDVMLGRLPAKNNAELAQMVTKLLRYEQEPEYSEWANSVLLMYGTTGPSDSHIEELRDSYWLPAGYDVTDMSVSAGMGPPDVLEALNRGQHIVYYHGHGETHRWELLHSQDVPQLTNESRLPAIFSMACYTGRFDHPEKDCLAEVFLKDPNGGVSFFGATRLVMGHTSMGFALAEAMADLNTSTLGEIVQHIRLNFLPIYGDLELYNLLGDPALDLGAPRRLPGKADLVATSANISLEPELPMQGESIVIRGIIQNIGDATARDVVVEVLDHAGMVSPMLNTRLIQTHRIPAIPAGGEATVETRWTPPLGEPQHHVAIRVHAEDSDTEHYTGNNAAYRQLLVSLGAEEWPVKIEESLLSAPIVADLDGDGDSELLVQSSLDPRSGTNHLYVWHHDGQPMSGWPRSIAWQRPSWGHGRWPHGGTRSTIPYYANSSAGPAPAAGDMDGDGQPEVVAAFFRQELSAWRSDGTDLSGWPVQTSGYATTSPVLSDLDSDGHLDVVAGTSDGQMHAYRYDGSALPGWPLQVQGEGHLFPIVANLDGDSAPEILALYVPFLDHLDTSMLYAWEHDGTPVANWSVQIPGADAVLPPAAGDLDGDGTIEVVAISKDDGTCQVYLWQETGVLEPGWPITVEHAITTSVVLGDMDGDGDAEVIACGKEGTVYAWHHDGRAVFGWPIRLGSDVGSLSSAVLGNVDADNRVDVVFTSSTGLIHAYEHNGTPVEGWPAVIDRHGCSTPAVLADLDADGQVELGFGDAVHQRMQLLSLAGSSNYGTEDTWSMFLRDPMHTSLYSPRAKLPLAPTDVTARDVPADKGECIFVSWQLSRDDKAIDGYAVFRSDYREGGYRILAEVPPGTTSYVDDTVQPGISHWYVVRSMIDSHLSAKFEPVSAFSQNNFAPEPPQGISTVTGSMDNTIELRWEMGEETDLAGYRVYVGAEPNEYGPFRDVGLTDQCTISELVNDMTCYLTITAYDSEGNESLGSMEISATPEDDDVAPPSFAAFYPTEATEGVAFHIQCSISDASGIYDGDSDGTVQGVYLLWDTDGEITDSAYEVSMSALSSRVFRTDLPVPAHVSGEQVVYQVIAYDNDTDWGRSEDRTEGQSSPQTVAVVSAPEQPGLSQNYPNPFNPETWLPYDLAGEAEVEFHIYNLSGDCIRTLELGFQVPGHYTDKMRAARWDGRNQAGELVAGGIYYYTLRTGGYTATRKMVLLR